MVIEIGLEVFNTSQKCAVHCLLCINVDLYVILLGLEGGVDCLKCAVLCLQCINLLVQCGLKCFNILVLGIDETTKFGNLALLLVDLAL